MTTKDNHFKQGYGKEFTNLKSLANSDWNFLYQKKTNRSIGDALTESLKAAEEISILAKQMNRFPVICLSGGIDSEFIAEVFQMSGVSFRLMTMRFPKNQNEHELFYVSRVAQRLNKEIEFFEVDPMHFYQSGEFYDWVVRYTSPFPMLNLQMKLIEFAARNDGLPVLGSGECYLEKVDPQGWCFFEREIFSSLFRFVKDQNLLAVPAFYQWSPELMLSFLSDPTYKSLYQKKHHAITTTQTVKHSLYEKFVHLEPRKKYYGWEKFESYETQLRVRLLHEHFNLYGCNLKEMKIPIELFIKTLCG